jgi:ribosomal protein S18 acetylase RimI-like enzyme
MTAIMGCARAKQGLRMLTLTVTEGNSSAISLYLSFGFQPFGIEPMAIHTPAGFKSKVHMWLPVQHHATAD